MPKAVSKVNYRFTISITVDIKASLKVTEVDYIESGNITLYGLEDLYEIDIPLSYNLDETYGGQYVIRIESTFDCYVPVMYQLVLMKFKYR